MRQGNLVFRIMPMELQIIRAQEFIRLGAKGHFDLKASKAVLAQLAAACCKRGINQALLDLRELQPGPEPVFSPDDLVTLVNTFREVGFTHQQRLAVLYSSDPHHRARLFALIAKMRRWKVQAFDSFEQAVMWLSESGGTPPEIEHTPTAKKVPVRQVKALPAPMKPAGQPKIIFKSPANDAPATAPVNSAKANPSSAFKSNMVKKISAPARPSAPSSR
jgi:hypothetical protein